MLSVLPSQAGHKQGRGTSGFSWNGDQSTTLSPALMQPESSRCNLASFTVKRPGDTNSHPVHTSADAAQYTAAAFALRAGYCMLQLRRTRCSRHLQEVVHPNDSLGECKWRHSCGCPAVDIGSTYPLLPADGTPHADAGSAQQQRADTHRKQCAAGAADTRRDCPVHTAVGSAIRMRCVNCPCLSGAGRSLHLHSVQFPWLNMKYRWLHVDKRQLACTCQCSGCMRRAQTPSRSDCTVLRNSEQLEE